MMVSVNGEYLDFDGDIEIESRIKLFEDIETANGDFSYSFDLSKTNKNLKALGFPFPDSIKSIYNNVQCEIIDESGFKIYTGTLQVNTINTVITCTFFGGNTDWFIQLSEPMSALNLYKYDVLQTESSIMSSWTRDSGIVYPILDTGTLATRSLNNFKVEDFTGCFYVKTLFSELFASKGIKITGDLLNDPTYKSLAVASNTKNQDQVDSRTSNIGKSGTQTFTGVTSLMTFTNESVFPFRDGSQNNWDTTTSRYTADVRMRVNVDISLTLDNPGNQLAISLRRTGAILVARAGSGSGGDAISLSVKSIPLEALEYLYLEGITVGGNVDVLSGYIKITPVFLYKSFGKSSVPNWTQGEFVSNILRIFNVLPSFDADSRTLTLDLFNKIKQKEAIDISEDVIIDEIDFSDFVSNYGKNNIFSYQEGSDEDLREYNISNFISYGSGNITIDNDFIENSVDVLESDFTSPITYLNGIFDISTERIDFTQLEEIGRKDIASVTNSAGVPRFNITNANELFNVGDIVVIDSDVEIYNGEWVINAVNPTYITVNGLAYDSNAQGEAILKRHTFTESNNNYLFIIVPNQSNLFFSSKSSMLLESTSFTSSSLAYFNLLSNNRPINKVYKQSLSFGEINNPLSYQLTIIDTYWPVFKQILSDPVMLKITAYFKKAKHMLLKTFLRPVRIKTNNTTNLYYLNSITGYKGGDRPCSGEVIKL